jgi:hypothetical protein
MNRLMDIKNNKEVSRVCCASEEEVNDFEEGTATGPELCPMRPYLNSNRHTTWNDVLCEMFVESFEEEASTELTPDAKATIEKMFLDRLSRLVRPWNESQKFSSEQLNEKRSKSNRLARRNTRRVDVSRL